MRHLPTQGRKKSLHRASSAVKAKVVAAGLKMGLLALQAGISRPSLSTYLGGQRRSHPVQIAIWMAFCKMTGQQITLADFWGELLSPRIAAGNLGTKEAAQ